MDRLIRRFDAIRDGDLMLCELRGVAYQYDMKTGRVEYGRHYFAKVAAYDGGDIAKAVNAGRCAMLGRHLSPGATVLDVGAGTGAFVRAASAAGFKACGSDVMQEAIDRLRVAGHFSEDLQDSDAVCMWDVIEHMEDPETVLRKVKKGAFLFVSLPIFEDLRSIRQSKHYRPGEHLVYWTLPGFIEWMRAHGFVAVEVSTHEVEAGRDSIMAFAFCRDMDYRDHIAAYKEMHSNRHYGSSATELHLETVAGVVHMRQPQSILDYGCGRSDLVAHFWKDGARRIARYDPAIGAYKAMPEGQFDLVLACDLMEHIPMASVDRVLAEVRSKGAVALFTISTKPARARLPDGRNAHVTLLTKTEWRRWIADVFGLCDELPSAWEHELVLLAYTVDQQRKGIARHREPCGGAAFHEAVPAGGWLYRCLTCEAPGPAGKTIAEAVTRWNDEQRAA